MQQHLLHNRVGARASYGVSRELQNRTDNNSGVLHQPSETGMSAAYALRTANKAHRTTPLRGLWQHPPYFHDGSAATLAHVVTHYNNIRRLNLSAAQQQDLVQYLKSL